jgi:5'-nucleotidase
MGNNSQSELVVGISSQALFDLREDEAIFQSLGPEEFCEYQIAQEEIVLEPGAGFDLVKSLLQLNGIEDPGLKVSVVLLSPYNADSSLRFYRSIESHGLDIKRVALTSGDAPARYLNAFKVNLYLSTNAEEVTNANHEGTAAAILNTGPSAPAISNDQIRIAIDRDTIMFSEESDRAFEEGGLEAFVRYERENASRSEPQGPFARLAKGLAALQTRMDGDQEPLRASLIADRNTPELERAIHAFRAWEVRLAEAFFLDGISKQGVLETFRPHIVFTNDLQAWRAATEGEATVHTPTGIHPALPQKAA